MDSPRRTSGIKRFLASVVFCAILFALLVYVGSVVKPTRSLLTANAGAAWNGYLQQPRDSVDAVFFGNSHVFDGVDPSVIWRRSGISSYVLAGPAQPLQLTRHYVAEAFRTQTPDVIVVETSVLTYTDRNYDRSFQLENIGYMPWGVNKLAAGLLDTPYTDSVGTLVDLWPYHSRWTRLKLADLKLWNRAPRDEFLKGFFVPVKGSRPMTDTTYVTRSDDSSSVAAQKHNMVALEQIAAMAHLHGAHLLLLVLPTAPPGEYSQAAQRALTTLSARYPDVKLLDLSTPGAVPGLSFATDFFDGGHLSTAGAEKASAVLAAYLAEQYPIADHRRDPAYARWVTDLLAHDRLVADVAAKVAARHRSVPSSASVSATVSAESTAASGPATPSASR